MSTGANTLGPTMADMRVVMSGHNLSIERNKMNPFPISSINCKEVPASKKQKTGRNTKAGAADSEYSITGREDMSFQTVDGANVLKLKVMGVPRPLYRTHYVARKGKPFGNVYTPSNGNKLRLRYVVEQAIRVLESERGKSGQTLFHINRNMPVTVSMQFHFARPSCHFAMAKPPATRQLRLSAPAKPTKVPDVDNLMKLVLDALEGVCYAKDHQVVSVRGEKHWLRQEHWSATGEPLQSCLLLSVKELQQDTVG